MYERKKTRASKGLNIGSLFKKLDQFGENKQFTVDSEGSYKSIVGSLVSMLINLLLLVYFHTKFLSLTNREEFSLYTIVDRNSLDVDEIYHQNETQFSFAIQIKDTLTNRPLSKA